MKKILAIILTVLFIFTLTALPSLAASVRVDDTPVTLTVKRADPNCVVKDGVISEGEYERFYVSVDPDESPLNRNFWSSEDLDDAEEMLPTMEYYFSWDDVHGFNFAVRNKPVELKQIIPAGTGDPPEDGFNKNVAYTFVADQGPKLGKLADTLLYYAVCKRTDTGEYEEGHYNQLGLKGNYNPTEGVDYVISYSSDGYSTIEWSVPFDNFVEGAAAPGTVFYFSIGAQGGRSESAAGERSYAIALGDWSWLVAAKSSKSHVTATLSDELIPAPVDPAPQPVPDDPTPAPADPDNPNPTPADPGNPNPAPADPGNPNPTPADPGNQAPSSAPRTGDPMIVMAAVAAVSAAGAFIIRKRRG
ncbi:MAG: hypothetical protein IJM71_06275 [Clostridia bacterium]|nr:hypothetical protein [Clostridia bacterium]